MLFNSYEFILAFLPIVLFVYILIGKTLNKELALLWLVSASLFFYSWWNPIYLTLILFSMVFNYGFGLLLSNNGNRQQKFFLLLIGVTVNLMLLGYFKYTNFLVDNFNQFFGGTISIDPIVLPLAISFFTFQQIAYLVDAERGETKEHSFLHYALFVTFFPQLIAGPIVHHKEMLPQFDHRDAFQLKAEQVSVGLTIFFIGLFKKVVLADNIALYSTPIFEAAQSGNEVSFFEAWGGALSYTFQLYFDFSGYADMAIGAARLFGIKLPLNFNSPYKSLSIIDFWRRWHMTLSRFLRDYVYFSLGGNRIGETRRYLNILITMLLGGIWHGAGWTFFIWGALHGCYILINHFWHDFIGKYLMLSRYRLWRCFSWLLTFLAVVFAWVFFRAKTVSSANVLVAAMLGVNGIQLPERLEGFLGHKAEWIKQFGLSFDAQLIMSIGDWLQGCLLITLLMIIALLFPNTQQFMKNFEPALLTKKPEKKFFAWSPNGWWAFGISIVAFIALLKTNNVSEFLYFQF